MWVAFPYIDSSACLFTCTCLDPHGYKLISKEIVVNWIKYFDSFNEVGIKWLLICFYNFTEIVPVVLPGLNQNHDLFNFLLMSNQYKILSLKVAVNNFPIIASNIIPLCLFTLHISLFVNAINGSHTPYRVSGLVTCSMNLWKRLAVYKNLFMKHFEVLRWKANQTWCFIHS